MRINRTPIVIALAAALALPAVAQDKKAETGKSESAKADANEPEEDIARASAEEDAQPKRGSVTVAGRTDRLHRDPRHAHHPQRRRRSGREHVLCRLCRRPARRAPRRAR